MHFVMSPSGITKNRAVRAAWMAGRHCGVCPGVCRLEGGGWGRQVVAVVYSHPALQQI